MPVPIRIFISSPSDVEVERHIALQVIHRLGQKFQNTLELKPVLWEREPLLASGHFQDALDPSNADLVVCILWSRLGSPLPESFQNEDSKGVKTGTEWEFDKALQAFEENGRPDILVYRKSNSITEEITDKQSVLLAIEQKEKLDQFFDEHFHNDDNAKTFKRAYFNFEVMDEFETLLETHLLNWVETKLETFVPEGGSQQIGNAQVSWHEGSPFRGLEVFEQNHADIFFGRTGAVGQVLAQFKDQVKTTSPFTMILGMSGSGKSSLVNAGLLPFILQPRVIQYEVGHVEVLRLRPAALESYASPLAGLCSMLVEVINTNASNQQSNIDPEILEEQITQSPKSLAMTLANFNQSLCAKQELHASVSARVLLMIDQFEELFTVKPFSTEMRRDFCEGIEALINTGNIWCLSTLRSDFVAETEGTKLVDLMRGQGQYTLQPPNVHELEQIILQPAKAAGLIYEQKDDGENLASVLRDAAQGQPGALPLLEFCLDQLFVHRDTKDAQLTFEAYDRIGRLEGAIGKCAEQAIVKLEEQSAFINEALAKVFHRLISINPESEETATARYAQVDQFVEEKEREILEALINARLLVVGGDDNSRSVRIAHEALINNWERVRQWINKDIEFLKWHAQTERDAALWQQEGCIKARLLQEGKPLTDARVFIDDRFSDIHEGLKSYIQQSIDSQKKNKRKRTVGYLSALAAVLVLVFLSWGQVQSTREKGLLLDVQQKLQLSQSNYLISLAEQTAELGDLTKARLIALNAVPGKHGGDRPQPKNKGILAQTTSGLEEIAVFNFYDDIAYSDLSSDAKYFVATFQSENKALHVWEVSTQKLIHKIEPPESSNTDELIFKFPVIDPSNKFLTATNGNSIWLWDIETGRLIIKEQGLNSIFLDNGKRILISNNKTLKIFETKTGKQVELIEVDQNASRLFAGRWPNEVWFSFENDGLYKWDTDASLHGLVKFDIGEVGVKALTFSPTNELVIVEAVQDVENDQYSSSAQMWNISIPEKLWEIPFNLKMLFYLFDPTGKQVIACPTDNYSCLKFDSNRKPIKGDEFNLSKNWDYLLSQDGEVWIDNKKSWAYTNLSGDLVGASLGDLWGSRAHDSKRLVSYVFGQELKINNSLNFTEGFFVRREKSRGMNEVAIMRLNSKRTVIQLSRRGLNKVINHNGGQFGVLIEHSYDIKRPTKEVFTKYGKNTISDFSYNKVGMQRVSPRGSNVTVYDLNDPNAQIVFSSRLTLREVFFDHLGQKAFLMSDDSVFAIDLVSSEILEEWKKRQLSMGVKNRYALLWGSNSLRVLDTSSLEVVSSLDNSDIGKVEWLGGSRFSVIDKQGGLKIYTWDSHKLEISLWLDLSLDDVISDVSMCGDGSYILLKTHDNDTGDKKVDLYRFSKKSQLVQSFKGSDGVFDPSCSKVVISGEDNINHVWSLLTLEKMTSFRNMSSAIDASFNRAGTHLLTISDGAYHVRKLESGEILYSRVIDVGLRLGGIQFTSNEKSVHIYTHDAVVIDTLSLPIKEFTNPIIRAAEYLPVGRKCLSESEREALFITPLSNDEILNRGCNLDLYKGLDHIGLSKRTNDLTNEYR